MEQDQKQERTFRLIIWGVAIAILLLFIVLNSETVSVQMIVFETDISLAWALLLAGFLGFVGGLALPKLRRP